MKPESSPSSRGLAAHGRLVTVVVAVIAAVLASTVVYLAGPSVATDVLPPPQKSTAVCTGIPESGVHYYLFYNFTTGAIEGGESTTGLAPTSNTTLVDGVHPGVLNISDQPALVHSICCWWQAGNSEHPPWHVDLATGQVLANPFPPAPIATYIWLDPTIVVLAVGGFVAWRLRLKRAHKPPPS